MQRLGQQVRLGQIAIDQDQARRRHVFIELRQKLSHHFGFIVAFGVRREKRAVAPVLPATNEKGLDRDLPALHRDRENVGIADPFGIDRLAALDESRRAQEGREGSSV